VLFFVTLAVIPPEWSKKLWVVLVVYSQVVVLLLYGWQVHFTLAWENSITLLIGLRHIDGFLFFGMWWNTLLPVFAVLQYKIYQSKDSYSLGNQLDLAPKFKKFVDFARSILLYVCYLANSLVALFLDVGILVSL
jgi:hypothetical protein